MTRTHFSNRVVPERGFTLIELLVVIAIIGILSAIVLASLNTARGNARNARKESDLHELSIALEQYYLDHGSAPDNTPPTPNWSVIDTSLQSLVTEKYLPKLPTSPDTTTVYYYYNYGTYMMLSAYLEPPAYGPGSDGWSCSDASGGSGATKYYCIDLPY